MGHKCEIHEATQEAVDFIREHLRKEDEEEIRAFLEGEVEPKDAIQESFFDSRWTWVLSFRGTPAVLCGVVPASEKMGRPWLVATSELNHRVPIRRYLALHSREYLDKIMEEFEFLYNWISVDNAFTISWLAWLGFVMWDDTVFERGGKKFVYAYYIEPEKIFQQYGGME